MRLKPKKTVFNERALLYRRYIGLDQSSLLDKIYVYYVGTNSNNRGILQYFQFNREEKRFIEIDPNIAIKSTPISCDTRTIFKYQDKLYQYWYKLNTNYRYWNIYSKNTLIINGEFNANNFSNTINFYTTKPIDSEITIGVRALGEGSCRIHNLLICGDNNYSSSSTFYDLSEEDYRKVYVANQPFEYLTLKTSTLVSSRDSISVGRINIYDPTEFKGTIEIEFPENVALINNLQLEFGDIAKYQMNNYYYVGSFDYMVTGNIEQSNTQYLKGNIMPLTAMNIKYYNDDINLRQDDLVVVNHHLYSVESPSKTHLHLPKDYYVYYATLNSIL